MYFNGYETNIIGDFKGKEPEGVCFKLYSQIDVIIPDYLSGIACPHRSLIPTGVEFKVQSGYAIFVYGRNALASIHGITMLSNVVLTEDSFGELKIVICNLGDKDFQIKVGDVIANGMVFKVK